jgi:ribose/xylose/arabinose/galactoside ABC-type transport system permease subunit
MKWARKHISDPSLRPFLLLVCITIVLGLIDLRVLTPATAYSLLQQFATLGPVALALGLSMMIGEFDLSVGGTLSVAGCVAVLTGGTYPALGLAAALAVGCCAGLLQGLIIVRLRISSIGVTLGGLLTLGGLSYVLTHNTSVGYSRMEIASAMNAPLWMLFSVRSLVTVALFLAAGLLVSWTRTGRDLLAIGSNRRAALIAGVPVNHILIGVFVVSGALTAIGGSLLSYSLAAASPVALADTLVPGAAAAILGGVSLSGGKGRPLGIAGGVLLLAMLRSGLTAIGVPPYVHDIVTGGLLLVVAIFDGEELQRRIFTMRRMLGIGTPEDGNGRHLRTFDLAYVEPGETPTPNSGGVGDSFGKRHRESKAQHP